MIYLFLDSIPGKAELVIVMKLTLLANAYGVRDEKEQKKHDKFKKLMHAPEVSPGTATPAHLSSPEVPVIINISSSNVFVSLHPLFLRLFRTGSLLGFLNSAWVHAVVPECLV